MTAAETAVTVSPMQRRRGPAIPRPKAIYNLQRIVADMTQRGWNDMNLAQQSGLSYATVSLFMRGERQTAKTADKIARALGYTVKRYLERVEAVA